MTCPKCEEGTIKKVILKMDGEAAFLCDYCGTLWLQGEEINEHCGKPFDVTTQGNAIEYILENSPDKDENATSARYTQFK